MKTALESLDALEALARKMATMEISPTALGMISGGLVYAPVDHYREARAIVSELPEPVDPDLITAREICADAVIEFAGCETASSIMYLDGLLDDASPMAKALTALRRAREEGVR